MATILTLENIREAIEKLIVEEININIEKVIEKSKIDVENQIRGEIGGICSRVLTYFDYVMYEGKIVITCDFKNTIKENKKN